MGPSDLELEFDPALVEEAVLLRAAGHPEERTFRRERDRIYALADPEERESAFRAFHGRWFAELGLARPVGEALRGEPLVLDRVSACRIGRAERARDEAAELLVAPPDRRTLRILLRPASLADPDRLLPFLRRELIHIADLVDERFGYTPELPAVEGDPVPTKLLIERYSALWEATIDGRLVRRGRVAAGAVPGLRAGRLRALRSAFPMLDAAAAAAALLRFFDGEGHTHAELVAFALDPSAGEAASGRCPLCRFPTRALDSRPLARAAAELIARDFPGWRAEGGACPQCADLYRARAGASPCSTATT